MKMNVGELLNSRRNKQLIFNYLNFYENEKTIDFRPDCLLFFL